MTGEIMYAYEDPAANSSKFWAVRIAPIGNGYFSVIARYGRIGTRGAEALRGTYSSLALAERNVAKLTDEKVRKGYVFKTTTPTAKAKPTRKKETKPSQDTNPEVTTPSTRPRSPQLANLPPAPAKRRLRIE